MMMSPRQRSQKHELADLDHDLKNLTALQFPIDDAEFRAEWHTYCRVENHSIDSASALALFWANRGGDLAKRAILFDPCANNFCKCREKFQFGWQYGYEVLAWSAK